MREMGRETPTSPTLFLKLAQALIDPDEPVVIPPESSQVDYEGELVAVIGRGGRRIPAEEALDHVAGVTLMNDVSMRDFQYRSLQWFAGKSWRACDAGRARGRHPRRARRISPTASLRRP